MNDFAHLPPALRDSNDYIGHHHVLFGYRRSKDRMEYPCPSLEDEDDFDLHRSEGFMDIHSISCKFSQEVIIPATPYDNRSETPNTASSRKRVNESSDDFWDGSPSRRQRIVECNRRPSYQRTGARHPDSSRQCPLIANMIQASNDFDPYCEDDFVKAPIVALERWKNRTCGVVTSTQNQRTDSLVDLDFKINIQSSCSFSSSQNDRKPSATSKFTSNDFLEVHSNQGRLPVSVQYREDERTLVPNKKPKRPQETSSTSMNSTMLVSTSVHDPFSGPFDYYRLSSDFASNHQIGLSSHLEVETSSDFDFCGKSAVKHAPASSPPRRVKVSDGRMCKVYSPARIFKNYMNGDKLRIYQCRGCQSGIACNPGDIANIFCTVCEIHTRADNEHFSGYYLHGSKLVLERS